MLLHEKPCLIPIRIHGESNSVEKRLTDHCLSKKRGDKAFCLERFPFEMTSSTAFQLPF